MRSGRYCAATLAPSSRKASRRGWASGPSRAQQRAGDVIRRIRREVLAGFTEHAAMHRDVGRGDDTAAAHRLDAGEVEAFAEARADRRPRMAIEQAKVARRHVLQQVKPAPLQPWRAAGKDRAVVPAQRADEDELAGSPARDAIATAPRPRAAPGGSCAARWCRPSGGTADRPPSASRGLGDGGAAAVRRAPGSSSSRSPRRRACGRGRLGEEVVRHHVRDRHRPASPIAASPTAGPGEWLPRRRRTRRRRGHCAAAPGSAPPGDSPGP